MNKEINELNMDLTTYNKVKGKLNPKERNSVTITGDKPVTSTSQVTSSSMATQMEENEIIGPKDKATIKYLSNVKDEKTGEISKPFTIGSKNYQMVRGVTPEKNIVVGVYCLDDVGEDGENIIHPMDYFEENIIKPMSENVGMVGQDIQVVDDGYDYSTHEREYHDKNSFIDYLNLSDIEPIFKHFFVNTKTGDIVAKFKNTKEMIKSGIKLGPDEDYMDVKALKRFRVGDYFKSGISEGELSPEDANTNVEKLQSDVKKLANLIKNKFGMYLSKLDKPIEQAQFLTAMANEIGVPLNKLSGIINTYKDIAKTDNPVSENKIITKKSLEESINKKRTIKVIKAKDFLNE